MNFQSQRSSCERCRQQKLKCVVSAETNGNAIKCDRCIRAKCDCIFFPRSQSKRARATQDPCASASRPSPVSTSGYSSMRGSVSGATSDGKEESSSASISSAMWNSIPFSPILQPFEQTILGVRSSAAMSGMLEQELVGDQPIIYDCSESGLSSHDQDAAATSWKDFSADDWLDTDIDALNTALLSPETSPQPLVVAEEQANSGSSSNTSWTAATFHRHANHEWEIVTLLGSIQQLIRSLLESPWQQDSRHSLSQYPVGAILNISQKFGTLMSTSLIGHDAIEADISCARNECSSGHNLSNASLRFSGTTTTSMLLILGGYSWLLEVYSTVFTHFQSHLKFRFAEKQSSTFRDFEFANRDSNDASANITTTLSEIPAMESSELIRLHLAVCMLQTELEQLVTRLSHCGTVTRKMAISLLGQENAVVNGLNGTLVSCGRLGEQVESIKILLKDMLGFGSVTDSLSTIL